MPVPRLTQLPIEVAEASVKPARVSQLPINVAFVPVRPARLTQLPINVVYVPRRPAQLTQLPIGTAFNLDPVPPRALLATYPVTERWQWLTTLVKSDSGKEQRMALREEPDLLVSYELVTFDDAERQALLYTFHRYIGQRLRYPMFHQATPILSTAPIGATSLEFDPELSDVRSGEAVAVYSDDLSIYRIIRIAAVTGTGCELAVPLEEAVAVGLIVTPAPLFRIEDRQSLAMTVVTGGSSLTLAAVPPRAVKRPWQTAVIDTFDSIPLLPDKYVLSGSTPEQVVRNLRTVQSGAQDPIDERVWYDPQVTTPRTYLIDRSDTDTWREFGKTVIGRQKPFLAPSYRNDFTLLETPALDSVILLTGDTFVADWMKAKGYRYLRIETANGTIYRKIAGARLNLDRTVTLQLTEALGGTAGDNQITQLSFMPKVRMASDEISIEYHFWHALVSFTIATVNE